MGFRPNLKQELLDELQTVLAQEEMLWLQKSRLQWIVDGERKKNKKKKVGIEKGERGWRKRSRKADRGILV